MTTFLAHWLLHVLGVDDVSGYWYGWWSGSGSVVIPPLLTSMPLAWVLLRRHNCEVHGCWRLGRHKTAAGHTVCRRHHPDDALTHEHILNAHERAKGKA